MTEQEIQAEIQKIKDIYEEYPDDVYVGIPVDEDLVCKVEEKIGLKFPKGYREYIKTFGESNLGGFFDVIGIAADYLGEDYNCSVVSYLETWRRRGLEEKYIPIMHCDEFAYVVDGTNENSGVYQFGFGMFPGQLRLIHGTFFEFAFDEIENAINNL